MQIDFQKFTSADSTFECLSKTARPERLRELNDLHSLDSWIPRGSGLSYVPSSFGQNTLSLQMAKLDRLLCFDEKNQILEVEAGASLLKVLEFLLPKGFILPVLPGHPNITIGGCIAQDVHGKNQFREGTFCDWVQSCQLITVDLNQIQVGPTQNKDLWYLTRSGFGLTGIILSAKIKVQKIGFGRYKKTVVPVSNLEETIEHLIKLKDEALTLYSWNDLRCGSSLGKGFIVNGIWQEGLFEKQPLKIQKISMNRRYPILTTNFNVSIINSIYRRAHIFEKESFENPLQHHFPIANKWTYYRSFGKNGFIEHQSLIPFLEISRYLKKFLALRKRSEALIALGTLKVFSGTQVGRSFQGEGIVFTWDIPRSKSGKIFYEALDRLTLECKGIVNLGKSSHLTSSSARLFYPDLDQFSLGIRAIDKKRKLSSEFSQRLEI